MIKLMVFVSFLVLLGSLILTREEFGKTTFKSLLKKLRLRPVMKREVVFTHNCKSNSKSVGIHDWLMRSIWRQGAESDIQKVN